jgi:transcriptional regulator with XRE-family HTH domain
VTQDQEQAQLAQAGARIRKLRESRGLNLHELARLCGISAPALSLIETGKRDLRLTSLYRIAAALRINAGSLLDGQDDQRPPRSPGARHGYDLGDYT